MKLNISLRNEIKKLFDKIYYFFAGKSKLNIVIEIFAFLFFGLGFISIPLCSFKPVLNIVTWIFTILFLLLFFLDLLLFYEFKIDFLSISFILFSVSALISSALCSFKAFEITAPILSILAFCIYTFCISSKDVKNKLLLVIYVMNSIFLFVFIVLYLPDVLNGKIGRLGGKFGDINNISIFMALGSTISLFYLFFKGGFFSKIINCLLFLLFTLFGAFSGSRIFVLLLIVVFIVIIFMFFGKRKWWLSLIILCVLFCIGVGLLYLPIFAVLKARIDSFLTFVFNKKIGDTYGSDYSSILRFEMFKIGMEMFGRKPLFGWGIQGFKTFGGFNNGWSHNNISESFCNFGAIGTLFFHVGFIGSFYYYNKNKSKFKNIGLLLVIFFLTCMISVALNSQKIYIFTAPIAFAICCDFPTIIKFNFNKGSKNENC